MYQHLTKADVSSDLIIALDMNTFICFHVILHHGQMSIKNNQADISSDLIIA